MGVIPQPLTEAACQSRPPLPSHGGVELIRLRSLRSRYHAEPSLGHLKPHDLIFMAGGLRSYSHAFECVSAVFLWVAHAVFKARLNCPVPSFSEIRTALLTRRKSSTWSSDQNRPPLFSKPATRLTVLIPRPL
jgi:hypothetical protein